MAAKKKTASGPAKKSTRSSARKTDAAPSEASGPAAPPKKRTRRTEIEDDLPLESSPGEDLPPPPSMNLLARRAAGSEKLPLLRRTQPKPKAAIEGATPKEPEPADDFIKPAEAPAAASVPLSNPGEMPPGPVEALTAEKIELIAAPPQAVTSAEMNAPVEPSAPETSAEIPSRGVEAVMDQPELAPSVTAPPHPENPAENGAADASAAAGANAPLITDKNATAGMEPGAADAAELETCVEPAIPQASARGAVPEASAERQDSETVAEAVIESSPPPARPLPGISSASGSAAEKETVLPARPAEVREAAAEKAETAGEPSVQVTTEAIPEQTVVQEFRIRQIADAPGPQPLPSKAASGEFALSRRAAWAGIAAFLVLLVAPPLWHDLSLVFSKPSQIPAARFFAAVSGDEQPDLPVETRLREFERELNRSAFTSLPRSAAQQTLLTLFNRGNSRVIPGVEDGPGRRWLFLRSEIETLTGWGPLREEPHGAARDPGMKKWQPPLPVILDFAQKLAARGVQLWLVPAPMKASIYPEKLPGVTAAGPLRHPDEAEFFRKLTEGGVRVIDLTDDFIAAKSPAGAEGAEPVYLRTDTHWSSWAVQHAASRVAGEIVRIAGRFGWDGLPGSPGSMPEFASSAPSFGDLVEMLGVSDPAQHFEAHRAGLVRALNADGRAALVDHNSPVVVLGDSSVNIFDDPNLGFAPDNHPAGERIGGGFSQQLSSLLTAQLDLRGIDVHAINGKGDTGVREEFFRRGETAVRAKKIVIWVIAARHLLMNRTAAAAENADWRFVDVSPDPAPATAPAGKCVIEAEVLAKSLMADPATANYADSLYAVNYRLKRVVSGAAPVPDNAEITVVQWNFRKRQPQPGRSVETGRTYRLSLDAWPQPALESLNLEDKFDTLQRWWAESVEPVPVP